MLFACAKGQSPYPPNIINTDSIRGFKTITNKTLLFIEPNGNLSTKNLSNASFTPLENFSKKSKIPKNLIPQTFYLRFSIQNNTASTKTYYYYPGKLYKKLKLYQSINGGKITAAYRG